MRFTKLSFPSDRLSRLLTSISVRTRIIVLALIPLVGFLANGLTYISGEGGVGTAFEIVKHSAALADASRDFKSTVTTMRIIDLGESRQPTTCQKWILTSFDAAT